jgi:ubiquinone/menaquinone biosynthesis C-methylase UbiE
MSMQRHLEAAFGAAAPEHYDWQTSSPFVAERERALVRAAFLPLGERLLDLGCGEGATLYHLGAPAGAVGVDIFEDKLAFARTRLPRCTFVAGSAYELPFPDASFDQVLVRDVVHHLEEPERMIDECRRVLAPGGRIDVLEPCRYNPLILVHAVTRPAERGELRSTETFLRRLVARRFRVVSTRRHQAMPIHRLVFHPDIGSPRLASRPLVRGAVGGFERLAAALLPKPFWAYLHVRGEVA